MALVTTFNTTAQEVGGAAKTTHGTFGLTGVYASGGVALTPRQFGLIQIHQLAACPSKGYVFEWDKAASKLKVYFSDNDALSDGPLVECPNGANVTTITGAHWKATGV
jgi:hypothetical protein